jgi:hypothetical protein
MTTTMTETELRQARHAAAVDQLEADLVKLELPAVEDIAGPILRALMAVHDFGAYTIETGVLATEVTEEDRFRDDAERIVRFVEDVATAVEHGVSSLIVDPDRSMHPANARAAVLAIFGLSELRDAIRHKAYESMIYGDN